MQPIIAKAPKTNDRRWSRVAATRDLPTIAFFRAGVLLRRSVPVPGILATHRPGAIMDKSGSKFPHSATPELLQLLSPVSRLLSPNQLRHCCCQHVRYYFLPPLPCSALFAPQLYEKLLLLLPVHPLDNACLDADDPMRIRGSTGAVANQAQSKTLDPGWPREITRNGVRLVYYQPQVDEWKNLRELRARFAFVLTPNNGKPVVGVEEVRGDTHTDLERRTVLIDQH